MNKLLQAGQIRPSQSPWASPALLVPKKNGEYRLCVDYRGLNQITTDGNYPMPIISDHLASFAGCDYFTALDLNAGFHQIRMAEADIPKTSFVVPSGQYEYLVMPFGLKGAPATCQRLLDTLLKDLPNTAGYMDDITIGSKDGVEHHLHRLQCSKTPAGKEGVMCSWHHSLC